MNMIDDESSMRLFFALWPGDVTRDSLAAWQSPLRALCGGDVMRADTLHSTLTFLGEVEPRTLEALCLAAEEVVAQRFEIEFDVARYWGHNHIVYAAPQQMPAALAALEEALRARLSKHRFRFDQREYKPHVTLLRHSKWSDTPLPEMPAVRWAANEFVLVRSLRDEQGPCYEVLARFGLSA